MSDLHSIRREIADTIRAGKKPVRLRLQATLWRDLKAQYAQESGSVLDGALRGRDVFGLPIDLTFLGSGYELVTVDAPDKPAVGSSPPAD